MNGPVSVVHLNGELNWISKAKADVPITKENCLDKYRHNPPTLGLKSKGEYYQVPEGWWMHVTMFYPRCRCCGSLEHGLTECRQDRWVGMFRVTVFTCPVIRHMNVRAMVEEEDKQLRFMPSKRLFLRHNEYDMKKVENALYYMRNYGAGDAMNHTYRDLFEANVWAHFYRHHGITTNNRGWNIFNGGDDHGHWVGSGVWWKGTWEDW